MKEVLFILFFSTVFYAVTRLLIADYFRHKEEFWDRIQVKVTKGQHNAEG